MLEAKFTGTDITLAAGDRVVTRLGAILTFLRAHSDEPASRRGVVRVKGTSGERDLFADDCDLVVTRRKGAPL